jgi:hypothetical protein
LLAHDRPCAFFVVVHVTGCVAEFVGCLNQGFALGSKARDFRADKLPTKGRKGSYVHSTGEGIFGRSVDEFECVIKIDIVVHINLGKACQYMRVDRD